MTGTTLAIRVRTKKGVVKIPNLTLESSLTDLKKAIAELASVESSNIKILKGYPPKPLDSSSDCSTLGSNSIKDGEMLTIEETDSKNTTPSHTPDKKPTSSTSTKTDDSNKKGVLLRKVVPANNSCLFTSVNFVMENGELNLDCQKSMRELIAHCVKKDPITFNEAILGKSNSEYCKWITLSSSWGGCIECMILSKHYKCEICVVDIRTGRIDRFGEDCEYGTRVFIIYDGIHFDPLYLDLNPAAVNNEKKIKTKFSTKGDDDYVMMLAYQLGNEAKNARQFTDVNNFKLRCLGCQQPLSGQKAAQDHAEKTGHINFGEY